MNKVTNFLDSFEMNNKNKININESNNKEW